jgi:uncharacterized protein YqjF (DUF2071 family)
MRTVLQQAGAIADELLARLAPASDGARQRAVISQRAHRLWPMPAGPWVQGQTWLDLLFAHWPLPVEVLRPAVPAELPLDTFHGKAWLGVTSFEVSGLRALGMPPVPRLSRFPETNVRTYTTVSGKPGVYFLSLDAASWAAVAGARLTYRLPYFRARMTIQRAGGEIRYRSRRLGGRAKLVARYRADGPSFNAQPGTLEYFLTERYCLYTFDARRRMLRAEIHHPPWPLQPAVGEIQRNTMTAPYGIELSAEPLLHFAARQDVLIWAPARLSAHA